MSVRHVLLGLLAAFVVIAGVYLFVQVRSTPSALAGGASPSPRDPPPVAVTPPPGAHGELPQDHKAAVAHQVATATTPTPPPTIAGDPLTEEDPAAALERPDVKIDAIMARANSAYDKGDWDEAKTIAGKVLAKQPTNIRMMRIMVSSSCIDGDSTMAQQWFEKLPKGDREQMKVRCDKYGVAFKEPAQ